MMQSRGVFCLALAVAIVLSAPLPGRAEGRPPKFRLEKEVNEKKLLEERRSEDRVTKVEQVGKEIDLTKRTNEKSLSALDLKSKFESEKKDIIIDNHIKDYIKSGHWTEKQIRDLSNTEPTGTSVDNRDGKSGSFGEPATVYGTRDRHIVINDKTRNFVQVSRESWTPDSRIRWKNEQK